jgi:hypothetical protein
LVYIIEMKSVYSAVRTGSLNKAVYASSLKGKYGPGSPVFRHINHLKTVGGIR